MLVYIIINISIILLAIGVDMWLHTPRQLRLSTLLVALAINSVVNIYIIGKYDFISYSLVTFMIIWAGLALLADWKLRPIVFETQKFVAFIVFTLMSISFFIIFKTSEDSYYMSIPYLSPAFFLIGASLLFLSTFQNSDEKGNHQSSKKLRRQLTLGTILIVLSFMIMTLLTPFWYIFVIIYLILILFLLWIKIF
ncbi:hypothetical protein [Staphylococcus debuckii]|uniref:hypothetical protein n=1 Tax=Staphylococcus debuckii TaxID=2044912 RepID=UPI000F43190C|nr:hypothetical protein [Staphylococcus debuckii]AYU54534.1 hypothetical protein CNQ82_03465 [Staphylococcus debuckii]